MLFKNSSLDGDNSINLLNRNGHKPESLMYPDSLAGKVLLLIMRDLQRLNWVVQTVGNTIEVSPPYHYDKEQIRKSMAVKRIEILERNKNWIDNHMDLARSNLANGYDVLESKIKPAIEVCTNRKQHDLFRLFRYSWSSPSSEYVGRRIRLIVRDTSVSDNPIIGIAALGSPIIHIPERDEYIGWNRKTRTQKINYMMDAYVIGALPPYNYLLGGKLMSYILASNEIRDIFRNKYRTTSYDHLAGIFTTSLYGRSSQYNRLKLYDKLKLRNELLYIPIGKTKGFGTMHITNETFNAMNDFLAEQGIIVSNRFGDGPSWRMRVVRNAGHLLKFNPNDLLRHSFKRSIYFVPLAKNSMQFLNGHDKHLKYYNQSLSFVTQYWKQRWLQQRKTHKRIIENVKRFNRDEFTI